MESNPESADDILNNLLNLSSLEGIALRFQCSSHQDISQSVMSLNAVIDHNEQDNEDVWYSLCQRLSKLYTQRLDNCHNEINNCFNIFVTKERLHCLQCLSVLHSPENLLKLYHATVTRMLMKASNHWQQSDRIKSKTKTEPMTFEKAVDKFALHTSNIAQFIEEDLMIFITGIFGENVNSVQAVKELYLDHVVIDIVSILDILETEITISSANNKNTSKGNQGIANNLSARKISSFKDLDSISDGQLDENTVNAMILRMDIFVNFLRAVEDLDAKLHSLCVQLVGLRDIKVGASGRSRRNLKSKELLFTTLLT